MSRKKTRDEALKRSHKQTLLLNSRELNAINFYCERYRINKSRFMREAIVTTVLKKIEDDHPVLFEPSRPNLFSNQGDS